MQCCLYDFAAELRRVRGGHHHQQHGHDFLDQLDVKLDVRQWPDDYFLLERCGNRERRQRNGGQRDLQRPSRRWRQHKWIRFQRHLEWCYKRDTCVVCHQRKYLWQFHNRQLCIVTLSVGAFRYPG